MHVIKTTHIGTASVLLEIGPFRFLTDPAFDGPGTYSFGYGARSTKKAEPSIVAEAVGRIDAVLLSHDQHADNLDNRGRALLSEPNIQRVITTRPGAKRLHARHGIGDKVNGLDTWQHCVVGSGGRHLTITAMPALHGPAEWFPGVGKVIGFLLEWTGDRPYVAYISGDTVLFPQLERLRDSLDERGVGPIDVAFIHAGGVRFPNMVWPLDSIRYTLRGSDVVRLASRLAPRRLVPIHYDGWSHFNEPESTLRRSLATHELRDRVLWLTQGRRQEIDLDD